MQLLQRSSRPYWPRKRSEFVKPFGLIIVNVMVHEALLKLAVR